MGRYFKAQEVELNRDFIYQPPIELMAKVIQGKDLAVDKYNEYQASIDEKLKAEGLKADEPRLREIINNYHSQIDERAKIIQSNPLEAAKEMGALKALGRDISDNWSQGEVAKIQGNKKLRDKYVEDLNKRKDVSEEWKTKALEKFDKEFTGTNFDNSGKYNDYKYENLNDKFDINEFLNKNLNGFEANGKKYSKDTITGQWIKTDGNSTEEVTFDELYKTGKQLLDSNQEAKDYYNQSQRLGFLTPEDAGYEVENALTGYANKYSYKKTSEDHSVKENPFYKWDIEMEYQRQADAQAKAEAKALSPNINTEEIFEKTIAQEQATEEWLQDLGKNLKNPVTNKPYVFNSLDHAISMLEKAKDRKGISKDAKIKLEAKLNKAIENKQQLLAASRATWSPLYDKFSEKTVDKLMTATQNDFNKNGMTYKYSLPGLQTMDGKGNIATATLKDKYQEFTPANMIGKKILTPDKKWVNISNVKLGESSVKPSFINGIINDKNINDNDARVILEFSYQEGDEIKTFKQPAYYNMKNNQGFSFNFDNN